MSIRTNKQIKDINDGLNTFYFELEILSGEDTIIMGFGRDRFPSRKIPGRTKFGGNSIGVMYSLTSSNLILYINKVRQIELKIKKLKRLGIGIFKPEMTLFVSADGKVVHNEPLKKMGLYFPVINLCHGVKIKTFFQE